LREALNADEGEYNVVDKTQLQTLAMLSEDQFYGFLEVTNDPGSWLETRIIDASSFHEGVECNACGIKSCSVAKAAHCPTCVADVYLTCIVPQYPTA
jgi:hypothetical protein